MALGGADDEPDSVAGDGRYVVFLMSGFRGNNLKAIRVAEAKGDITGTPAIAWTLDRDTPYVPSPLLYDGILYFLKTNNGLLSAFDAKTGKPHYQIAAARRGAERVCVAGGGGRADLHSGPRRHRRSCSGKDRRWKCSPSTNWTTGSTRPPRSSTARCTCAATGICTA